MKMITKIITKCNFDFQTCANYQFFPFQDNVHLPHSEGFLESKLGPFLTPKYSF